MGVEEEKLRKGAWIEEEDEKLIATVSTLGEQRWDALAKASGLRRSGKSCRLRWMNYLRPNLKHARINAEEEIIIFQLHSQWGNKWSKIAQKLPGRTDNEIKNYWRSQTRKKTQALHPQEHYCSNELPINDSETNQHCNGEMWHPNSSIEDCISVKCDIAGISSSNYDTRACPYEGGSTDWIYSDAEESFESRIWYPELLSGSNDISIWDSSYSIWNAS